MTNRFLTRLIEGYENIGKRKDKQTNIKKELKFFKNITLTYHIPLC